MSTANSWNDSTGYECVLCKPGNQFASINSCERTEVKLGKLKEYLVQYTKIFTSNPQARFFRRIYVDAFAGSGARSIVDRTRNLNTPKLFQDVDQITFREGSVSVSLKIDPPFDEYLFIERQDDFALELMRLREEYPLLANRIDIRRGEANSILMDWIATRTWRTERAVVFLDPYGMQVVWSTLEALAGTKAVDLWLLFPLGQGVNRLLTRDGIPPESWAKRLTAFFGNEDWKDQFYMRSAQTNMFNEDAEFVKSANFETITKYFVQRLKSIFFGVTEHPLVLRNSRNSPIFLLCFAAANEKGSKPALNIANHLLRNI